MRIEQRNHVIRSNSGLGTPKLIATGTVRVVAVQSGTGKGVMLYCDYEPDNAPQRRIHVYLTAAEIALINERL